MADFDVNVALLYGWNGSHFEHASTLDTDFTLTDNDPTSNRFEVGESVSLAGFPGSATFRGNVVLNGITYLVLGNSLTTAVALYAQVPDPSNVVASDFTLDDINQVDFVVCFVRGTLIDTPQGPVAVEDLTVGDMVITADRGAKPIRWIGSVRVSAAGLAANRRLRPIRIRAGALGKGTPTRDLWVSPRHRVLVRSRIAQRLFGAPEVLVAAKQLLILDGINIDDDMHEVEYFHFLFDRHEVVFSNGAATETLFTGPEALRGVGPAAREEILALFPQLQHEGHIFETARSILGRKGRKLAARRRQHGRELVC